MRIADTDLYCLPARTYMVFDASTEAIALFTEESEARDLGTEMYRAYEAQGARGAIVIVSELGNMVVPYGELAIDWDADWQRLLVVLEVPHRIPTDYQLEG